MCDWCEGGAVDLVYNKAHKMYGEINAEDGVMTFTYYPEDKPCIQAGRIVNFCPMRGKPVGSSRQTRFLKELRKVFGCNISTDEVKRYAGSIGWNIAKQRVPEFKYLEDSTILGYFN